VYSASSRSLCCEQAFESFPLRSLTSKLDLPASPYTMGSVSRNQIPTKLRFAMAGIISRFDGLVKQFDQPRYGPTITECCTDK